MDHLNRLKNILSKERPMLQDRSYLNYDKGKTFRKSKGTFNVCVVYANTYLLGMSNLGFHIVCEEFDKCSGVQVDRAFMSEKKNEEVRACITGRLLSDFDMVVFSIPYELDYLNIPSILKAGNIEPEKQKRNSNTFVCCGGIAPSINPCAVAEYMDMVFVGDAEILIPVFFEKLQQNDYDLDKLSRELCNDGFYFPELKNQFVLKKISKIERPFYSTVVTSDTSFSDTVLIDAGRGCSYSCKFCVTGNYLKPNISVDARFFTEIVENCSKLGVSKFGIISSCIGKIPSFESFLDLMIERKIEINVSSLRFEDLDDNLIDKLYRAGQNVFTLAPETATDYLRYKVGKPIKNELITDVINKVLSIGASVKLYFMVGLPEETKEDILAIVKMLSSLKGKPRSIRAGIQPFVPKPQTPFGNQVFAGEKHIKDIYTMLRNIALANGINKDVITYTNPKEALMEYTLSWKGLR